MNQLVMRISGMLVAAVVLLSACTAQPADSYQQGLIEAERSGSETKKTSRIVIAGNSYSAPGIPNFPHLLELHYSGTNLYIDAPKNGPAMLVYAAQGPRTGIAREIPLKNHNLTSVLDEMDDPTAELLDEAYDDEQRPFWIRFKLHDASLARREKSASGRRPPFYVVDLVFEKKEAYVYAADDPRISTPLNPSLYRPENMKTYEQRTVDTVNADFFDGNGNPSFVLKQSLYRKTKGFSLWRTADEFHHGCISSSVKLARSGSPIRNDATITNNVTIDGETSSTDHHTPYRWHPFVLKVHAGGRSNLYLYPDSARDRLTLIDIENNRIYHASFTNKDNRDLFFNKTCDMRFPLLTSQTSFNPGDKLNDELVISWSGKGELDPAPRRLKKFSLKIDLRKNEAEVKAIE